MIILYRRLQTLVSQVILGPVQRLIKLHVASSIFFPGFFFNVYWVFIRSQYFKMRFLPFDLKLSKIYKSWVKSIIWWVFIIENFFHEMYFNVFHPLPIPPGPFPPSYIPNFMFSLSKIYIEKQLHNTHTPQNIQVKNQKIQDKVFRWARFVLLNYSGHRAYHEVWAICPVRLYWRKLIFTLRVVINCR